MHVSTLGHFIPQMAGLIWLPSMRLLSIWSGTYIQRELMHPWVKLYAFMLKALKLAFKWLPLISMFAKHLSMIHFISSITQTLLLFERKW